MAAFDVIRLEEDFTVVADASKILINSKLSDQVDRIWDRAVQREPHLFNGRFFNCENYSEKVLHGRFLEYKYFYAGVSDPELRKELKLLPVGVSGITRCNEVTLVGKRSDSVSIYRGLYEFVPAGSLDPIVLVDDEIDLKMQYLVELEEEAGITPVNVKGVNPFLLVRDHQDDLIEIVARITLNCEAREHTLINLKEYTELFWLDNDSLLEHFGKHSRSYVPFIRQCLSRIL